MTYSYERVCIATFRGVFFLFCVLCCVVLSCAVLCCTLLLRRGVAHREASGKFLVINFSIHFTGNVSRNLLETDRKYNRRKVWGTFSGEITGGGGFAVTRLTSRPAPIAAKMVRVDPPTVYVHLTDRFAFLYIERTDELMVGRLITYFPAPTNGNPVLQLLGWKSRKMPPP